MADEVPMADKPPTDHHLHRDLERLAARLGHKVEATFDWRVITAKYGFTGLLVLLLLGFIRYDIVAPQRLDQHEFMQAVIKANDKHADTVLEFAKTQQAQTAIQQTQIGLQQTQTQHLGELTSSSKKTAEILQEIRDDQRAGVWKRAESAKN